MAEHQQSTSIHRMEFSTDNGAGARARIGLLVLESDQTMELEFRQLTDLPGVAVYHARLANDVTVSTESLARMESELPVAAGLLPNYLGLRSIGYGCTSGSTIIGEERVSEILASAHADVPSTNPLTAAKCALKVLGVQNLALLTPYPPEVTEAMQKKFVQAGVAVTVVGSFEQESDLVVGKIDPESILRAVIEIGQSDAVDGVFVSCTSLRAVGIIDEAESTLGKPVTSSNHALAWHLLRLAGVQDHLPHAGRLFQMQLGS